MAGEGSQVGKEWQTPGKQCAGCCWTHHCDRAAGASDHEVMIQSAIHTGLLEGRAGSSTYVDGKSIIGAKRSSTWKFLLL